MKPFNRRQLLGLGGLAALGALVPGRVRALPGLLETILEYGHGIEESEWVPPPKSGVRFGMVIDLGKCIGCRYCMQGCPYQARRYNWYKPEVPAERVNPLVPVRPHGVVEKCTFCVHRTRLGKTTRCVEACPNKVRTFGNLNDPNSEVSKLIRTERSFRLKEGLNTGPQIWYLTAHGEKSMRWYKALPPPTDIRGIR